MSKNNNRRKGSPPFVMLRHDWIDSENFVTLSQSAKCLFVEFLRQYNGSNNGDLCAAWGILKKRGWKSRATIDRAVVELMQRGWIVKTRTGSRRLPNLYAVTVHGIDEVKGKIYDPDIEVCPVPLNTWKKILMPQNEATVAS